MLSATIKLTDDQVEELRDLFIEVSAAQRLTKSSGREHRYAIMGQVFFPDDEAMGDKMGCAKFYLLNTEQYRLINAAIRQALKMDLSPSGEGEVI